ncbi:MAG: hypothetical protein LC808_29395, partial [Actinobacteria bacterium]|nr:hypothetical protein [Actinomycetota bacterium]
MTARLCGALRHVCLSTPPPGGVSQALPGRDCVVTLPLQDGPDETEINKGYPMFTNSVTPARTTQTSRHGGTLTLHYFDPKTPL